MRCTPAFAALPALLALACASAPPAARNEPVLVESARQSHWPVEGETRPGIWFRFESGPNSPAASSFLGQLTLTVEHDGRRQVIAGTSFAPVDGGGGMHQTRYMYHPQAGPLFVTLSLGGQGRHYFPDTQRIELNDDCWHMVSYRVRGPLPHGQPALPPPHPRTAFLTAAASADQQLFLDVFLSGNCFRNPLPPH